MKSFVDKNGKSWDIDLNIGAAIKIKSRCGIDLENIITVDKKNQPQDVSTLERLAEDSILLFEVIFAVCENQVRAAGMNEESFAELFNGDAIEAATNALVEEIINFSRPAKRKVLTRLWTIGKNFSEKAGRQMDAKLNSPEFEKEVEKALTQSLTNAPESSEA